MLNNFCKRWKHLYIYCMYIVIYILFICNISTYITKWNIYYRKYTHTVHNQKHTIFSHHLDHIPIGKKLISFIFNPIGFRTITLEIFGVALKCFFFIRSCAFLNRQHVSIDTLAFYYPALAAKMIWVLVFVVHSSRWMEKYI